MIINILNHDFERVAIIDDGASLIWTDRYRDAGDFELAMSIKTDLLSVLIDGNYVQFTGSIHTMEIESVQTTVDILEGNKYSISGRSMEQILDRRVVWDLTRIEGSLQDGIFQLLDENFISPADPNRMIANFEYETSTDPAITSLTMNDSYDGENIYDVIRRECQKNDIGFRVLLTEENKFVFSLYAGVDRSYDQIDNPYVIFSNEFDNIINSNFFVSTIRQKTATLILGADRTVERYQLDPSGGTITGVNRREMMTEAQDVTRGPPPTPSLDDAEYEALLLYRGLDDLHDNSKVSIFDGEMLNNQSFAYGEDFYMGDIVQIENEYGQSARSRVTELVYSESRRGVQTFPSFTTMQ